ncbi:preprotein translocase subunit SecG [Candidatus Absconditicoccus praedator]|uniref:preprotein translocase subunit SecG n=1 Tax=Candidatus Absconditicoccus praedator TaxID=2735562 RepID=UPI001E514845|nr:preprotein translocase subunit SecG [Candidatus Absconditicoccus praedator]UFX83451.1 preprotein translocase subunit SecG [Candidatus Absconditicoccus praedator]
MRYFLIGIMILSGIAFVISVLLMSPKGGLGVGVGGALGGGSDYGSQKSLEGTLKKSAVISSVVFIISSIFLPYVD